MVDGGIFDALAQLGQCARRATGQCQQRVIDEEPGTRRLRAGGAASTITCALRRGAKRADSGQTTLDEGQASRGRDDRGYGIERDVRVIVSDEGARDLGSEERGSF